MKMTRFGILLFLVLSPAHAADSSPIPDQGFSGDRYAGLWKKSPFAIATPDAPAASSDYQFIALAKFDGVTYVSLIDKQAQGEHFVLSSDKPVRNLTLVSTAHDSEGTSAVVERNGQRMTLQLETGAAPAPAPFPNPAMNGQPPLGMPLMPMTSTHPMGILPPNNGSVGGMVPAMPPLVRSHHRVPRIPSPPSGSQ